MAVRIDGKAVAAKVRGEIAEEVAALKKQGVQTGMAVVLVGEDPASKIYVRNKGKACSHAGIYIGNGQHVHASSSRNGGVITSDLTSGYYNTYFVGGLRLS